MAHESRNDDDEDAFIFWALLLIYLLIIGAKGCQSGRMNDSFAGPFHLFRNIEPNFS